MEILLIEPDYKNKYPPLGLMKLSTFHKKRGDTVVFFKGQNEQLQNHKWDRIYISTLFTFHWEKTIKTIKYYLNSTWNSNNIFIGGVMATLMKNEILEECQVNIVLGLLDRPGQINLENEETIDSLIPDYSIIEPESNTLLNYSYTIKDTYLTYATRGCVWKCSFCAVPIIEPVFSNSLSIQSQVNAIRDKYGEKRNLILMDNNILASTCFPKIIEEIKALGFYKGAMMEYSQNGKRVFKKRFVDFNQGIDARLLTKERLKLISEISINPLRIAFDDIKFKENYIEKVRLASSYGIKILSNYILFNYQDNPEDFYERLKINIDLNEEFNASGSQTRIWSFPMRYTPIKGPMAKSRGFIGENWNKKYLRGIQCILLATHGVVGPRRKFFEKAFGIDVDDFKRILMLPEDFIILRNKFDLSLEMDTLNQYYNLLTKEEKEVLEVLIRNNDFHYNIDNYKISRMLELYKTRKYLWKKQ